MTRDEQLADLYAAVKEAFPRLSIMTNKGMNPATPLSVTARWSNGKVHAARARSLNIDLPTFKTEVIAELKKMNDKINAGIASPAA